MDKKEKDEKKEPVSFPVEEIRPTKVGGSMRWPRTIMMWFLTIFALCYVASKADDGWREVEEVSGIAAHRSTNSRVGTAHTQLSCDGLSCETIALTTSRKTLIEPLKLVKEKDRANSMLCHNGDSVVLYLSQGQFIYGPGTGLAPLQPADWKGFYAKPVNGSATLSFCQTK